MDPRIRYNAVPYTPSPSCTVPIKEYTRVYCTRFTTHGIIRYRDPRVRYNAVPYVRVRVRVRVRARVIEVVQAARATSPSPCCKPKHLPRSRPRTLPPACPQLPHPHMPDKSKGQRARVGTPSCARLNGHSPDQSDRIAHARAHHQRQHHTTIGDPPSGRDHLSTTAAPPRHQRHSAC
jgi:hypothetical protein